MALTATVLIPGLMDTSTTSEGTIDPKLIVTLTDEAHATTDLIAVLMDAHATSTDAGLSFPPTPTNNTEKFTFQKP